MLNGKNAIVTGGESGIGNAIVHAFAKNRANVWALVYELDEATKGRFAEWEQEYGVWIKPIFFNLFDESSVKAAIKTVVTSGVSVDILVNCAGVAHSKTLGMTSLDDIQKCMTANFMMPSLIMQLVSRKMMRQKSGVIINIASKAVHEYRAGTYAYGSSKAAILWGTRAVAKELAPYNIRVNGVAPGLTETRLGSMNRTPEETERYVSTNNIKRTAQPDEIANTILFLASDMSSYISGQIINVDGGRY